jgi:hypothetical protein
VAGRLTTTLVVLINTDISILAISILTRLKEVFRGWGRENLLWGEWVRWVGEIFA